MCSAAAASVRFARLQAFELGSDVYPEGVFEMPREDANGAVDRTKNRDCT
jgi:hypothetical protein